jgi:hypothetical protein
MLVVLASCKDGDTSGSKDNDAGRAKDSGGSSKDGDASRSYSAADVEWMSISYPLTMDASVPVTVTKVQGSGAATCSWLDPSSGIELRGSIPAQSSIIPDLLARPGLVDDLATPCPLVVFDGGPYINTRFAIDEDQVVHGRLASCSTNDLQTLLWALQVTGEACMAVATVVATRDAGQPESGADGPTVDASAIDAPGGGVGECRGELSELATRGWIQPCTAQVDAGTPSLTCLGRTPGLYVYRTTCDQREIWRWDYGGTHSQACFYDRGALVGARLHNDTPAFCGNTSTVLLIGTTDGCPGAPDALVLNCNPFVDADWRFPSPDAR